MDERISVSLRDGTLVRHKTIGYQGKVEGTTAIKACFTKGGALQGIAVNKESFQYRVAVDGLSLRYIAPVEDLEVIEAVAQNFYALATIHLFAAHYSERSPVCWTAQKDER